MNVFAEDITIEDDMAVLVKYNNGATMTYHLTAYSVCHVREFGKTRVPNFSRGRATGLCSMATKAVSSSR